MSDLEGDSVAARLASIEARIFQACRASGRSRSEVRLIAISKKQPIERLLQAYEVGQRVFGENYLKELEGRVKVMPADVEWHFVGHLQRNKAKKAAQLAALIHTVDSLRLAEALDAAATGRSERLPILVQINIDREATKSGIAPEDAPALLSAIAELEGLDLRGLMAIPEPGAGRRPFAQLRTLAEQLRVNLGLPLPELSMGMSADFVDAVQEGATLVRIGTELFGARGPGI